MNAEIERMPPDVSEGLDRAAEVLASASSVADGIRCADTHLPLLSRRNSLPRSRETGMPAARAWAVVKGFLAIITRYGFAPFGWYRIVAGAGALVWLTLR